MSGLQLTLFGVSHIDTVHSLVHCITLVTYIKSLFVTQFSFYIRFSYESDRIYFELRRIRLKLQNLQSTLKMGSCIISTLPDATLSLFFLAPNWCRNLMWKWKEIYGLRVKNILSSAISTALKGDFKSTFSYFICTLCSACALELVHF